VPQGADHGYDLSAMELGMIEHVPQDFPAGKARPAAWHLHSKFHTQAALGLVLQPVTVVVPEFGPALLENVKRQCGSRTLGKQEGSKVRSVTKTGKPDSFSIVEVAKSGQNAGVRDAKIALQFLAGES